MEANPSKFQFMLMKSFTSKELFILLHTVGYLGIDVSPTPLPQWFTLIFLLYLYA